MRVVLTGGGTGGHVVPNMSVIEELKKRGGSELLYIGSNDGVEKAMIEKRGVNFQGISCGKFRRYASWQNFIDIFKVVKGVIEAKKVLKKFKPDVIFSKGGFVSFPVVFVARSLKIPLIVHESDLNPGMANRFAFMFAKKICVSFEETLQKLKKKYQKKTIFTGSPIRTWIKDGNESEGYRFTGLNDYRPVILVMGGSQGAEQINKLLRANLDELLKKFQVVHLTGRGKLDIGIHKKGYKQYEYLDKEIKDVYAISDLVVSRGGANSLFEIAYLKKKAVIIPLSFGSRGDQIDNARVFVKNFGWSMLSGDITEKDFLDTIYMAYESEINDDAVVEDGTKKIADIILNKGR